MVLGELLSGGSGVYEKFWDAHDLTYVGFNDGVWFQVECSGQSATFLLSFLGLDQTYARINKIIQCASTILLHQSPLWAFVCDNHESTYQTVINPNQYNKSFANCCLNLMTP